MATYGFRNPKKPTRHDDEPPDIGRSLPPTTDPPSPLRPTSPVNPRQPMSYKDSLMGESNDKPSHGDCLVDDDAIEILVGEVTRSIVDGMISIQLSERIQTLAAKSMGRTIILKLLGRRIATFHSHDDFLTVLTDGPWTIFGHYLTVEPWSPDFSPSQPYPSKVIAWIRLPDLPTTLYKRSLIDEIDNCIDHVVRIDYQTESGCRGRFACMAIRVDLNMPLVSKLLVNGKLQIVEYECLPTPARKPHTNEARQDDDVASGSRFNPLYLDGEEAQVDENIPNSGQVNDYVPLSPCSTRKGKQPVTVKQLRAVNVRKPLTTSVNDFPIIPRSALKASSSRSTCASHKVTILDKSRHFAIVLPENSNPNLQLVTSAQDFPSSRKNVHTMGDPPDADMELLPSLPVKDPGDVLNDSMFNDGVQFESHGAVMLD
ncbi:hypothetical protein V6N11_031802 [Hibiscus sabdariffa]|uniref:DUF4283 domain-containing protein n=1 Tax=Hibiscus sabdariffa TaxID=183260 RepID=A0ABR2SYQ4_9ROSI